MIRRSQIEPGAWFAVPIMSPDAPQLRADLAFLHVTATDGFRVHYVEYRDGRARPMCCSPEVFQIRVSAEGVAVGVRQVPAEVVGGINAHA